MLVQVFVISTADEDVDDLDPDLIRQTIDGATGAICLGTTPAGTGPEEVNRLLRPFLVGAGRSA